jgi:hypothetical protein
MRGLIPSSEWIRRQTPNAVSPPKLYSDPPEGWHAWAADLTGLPPTKPDTHSGNIVAAAAPGWAQWLALKRALMTAAAQDRLRAPLQHAFEAGRPLSLLAPDSVERFVDFAPLLRFHGDHYTVGLSGQRAFEATDHARALDQAGAWFTRQRAEEIDRQRQRASEITGQLPPIYVDLAVQQLTYDGILLNRKGDLMAIANGPHGFYIVGGQRWCYSLEQVSPATAARLALLGAHDDEIPLLLRPELYPVYLGLDTWTADGAGFRWQDGELVAVQDAQWRIVAGDRPLALVALEQRAVRVSGRKRKVLIESARPAGFDTSPTLVWATWRTLRRAEAVLQCA